jgi:hypothetical protein
MVIFLFRRNTLRRLVSVLANDYDRRAKQLNGTHKAHVHSREEVSLSLTHMSDEVLRRNLPTVFPTFLGSLQAEILARFRPELEVSSLIPSIRDAEQSMDACLRQFRATRHMILYYEDLIRDIDNVTKTTPFQLIQIGG